MSKLQENAGKRKKLIHIALSFRQIPKRYIYNYYIYQYLAVIGVANVPNHDQDFTLAATTVISYMVAVLHLLSDLVFSLRFWL